MLPEWSCLNGIPPPPGRTEEQGMQKRKKQKIQLALPECAQERKQARPHKESTYPGVRGGAGGRGECYAWHADTWDSEDRPADAQEVMQKGGEGSQSSRRGGSEAELLKVLPDLSPTVENWFNS